MAIEKPSRWTRLLPELPVLALVLDATAGLLNRGHRIEDLLIAVVAAGAGLAAMRGAWTDRLPEAWRGGWRNLLVSWLWLTLVIWAAGRLLSVPPGIVAALYLTGIALLFSAGLRGLRRLLPAAGDEGWREDFRLAALATVAVVLFRPFLTPMLLGGLDARWYGYSLMDALAQVRAGVFPVFVGQGEYMFNGAVHPFRTAPFHHYFGILLDALTGRTLAPLAVQHLTVIGTVVLGTLGCYAGLASLAPARRWSAWVLALLYVNSPVLAGYIYGQEMYMTFMSFAWLPWVAYGNIRVIQRDDRIGWICLIAGLALVWVCHAPVGTWLSFATLGIQGLRLLTRDFTRAAWTRAVWSGAGFAGLTLYYFWSVAEIAPPSTQGSRGSLLAILVLMLGVGALIRFMASARLWWLGPVAAAGAVLWSIQRAGSAWIACAVPGAALVAWCARRWSGWRDRLPECAVVVLLVSGTFATQHWPDLVSPEIRPTVDEAVAALHRVFPQNLQPVTAEATAFSDLQLGWVNWFFLALGLVVTAWKKPWELRLPVLVALLLAMMYVPVPLVSTFLFSLVPRPVAVFSGINLWLRFVPVLATLAVFIGALAFFRLTPKRPLAARALGVVLLALVLWNLTQVMPFVRRGARSVNSPAMTAAFDRTENAQLYYYSYNNMPAPGYFTNGVVDSRLESRLLRATDQTLLADPLFSRAPTAEITFATRTDMNAAYWLHLRPKLTLQPGERVLLEFSFFDKTYAGVLRFQGSTGLQRDYFLPDAGPFGKHFGVGPGRAKTLSLWNSTGAAEEIEANFLLATPPAPGSFFGDFARVSVRRFTLAETRIRTVRLIPHYEAEVETDAPAFLETPRVYIPGYQASVNGHAAPVAVSPDHLAMVRLEPGRNHVELIYRGTVMLKLTMTLSLLAWLVLLVFIGREVRCALRPVGSAPGAA